MRNTITTLANELRLEAKLMWCDLKLSYYSWQVKRLLRKSIQLNNDLARRREALKETLNGR